MLRSVALALAGLSLASAFAPQHAPRVAPRTSSSLPAVISGDFSAEIEASRTAFFIWFFGASGAAGIARSAFPRMYNQVTYIQSLAGEGPTKGGENIGINTALCGYPEDIKVADVQQIVSNRLNVKQIVDKFPIEGNFLSRKGYLTFAAFQKANANANPLAVRAVFDTFAQSTDSSDPRIAQAKIDSYKQDASLLKGELVKAKLLGFSAIATLLFLLGLADIVASGHAYHGWFPSWPGGQNFPWCIFDAKTGPWTIPDYWI